jgi:plastocyanin
LKIAADPKGLLAFNTKRLASSTTHVVVEFTNASPLPHNLTVANASGRVLGATPTFTGGTKTLTMTLPAGTYTYYCSVPGHEAAGMKGTLTVSPSASPAAPAPVVPTRGPLKISANPHGLLSFSTTTLASATSHVVVEFTNSSPLPHNFTVANAGGRVLGATPTFTGGTRTLTLTLPAGTYTYYCSVPGHEAAGMKGTLTVGSGAGATGGTGAGATGATGASPTNGPLQLSADPSGQLSFDTTTLASSTTHVVIDFTNSSPLPHNVTIANASGKVLGATPTFSGGTKTLTLTLPAGTYTYYCSVPGHEAAGMKGTLTVR